MNLNEEVKRLEELINGQLEGLIKIKVFESDIEEIKIEMSEFDIKTRGLLDYKFFLKYINSKIYKLVKIYDEHVKKSQDKINSTLDSLVYFKELLPVVEKIKSEIEGYDIKNKRILAYSSFLDDLLNYKIAKLNKLDLNRKDNLFDDRSEDIIKDVTNLENDIEETIDYLFTMIPEVAELVNQEYQKYQITYKSMLDGSYKFNQTSFYSVMGVYEPCLTLYGGPNSLYKYYLKALKTFEDYDLKNLKTIASNDSKIKELFNKIKNIIKSGEIYENVLELEKNYQDSIDNSSVSYSIYKSSNLLDKQIELLQKLYLLEQKADTIQKESEYLNYLSTINFTNIDTDKLLEIQKYVNETGKFAEEFYNVIYVLVEKEKYIKSKYGMEYKVENNLIDNLSKETLIKLENIFVDRLSLLNNDDVIDVIRAYKENGYLNVLDKVLAKELEKEEIQEKIILLKNVHIDDREEDYKRLSKSILECVKERIIDYNKKHVLKTKEYLAHNNPIQVDENVFKIPIVYKEKKGKYIKTIPLYLYFNSGGKRIKNIPEEMNILKSVRNYYILNNPFRLINKETFETIYDDTNSYKEIDYKIDFNNKSFVILAKDDDEMEYLFKFNFNGELLSTCSIKDALSVVSKKEHIEFCSSRFCINHYDDDIVGIKLTDSKKNNYYYCLFNMNTKEDIVFSPNLNPDSDYIEYYMAFYNNRVLVIGQDNSKKVVRYYNKTGELVIDKKYSDGTPFSGGIAYVTDLDEKTHHLIDVNGTNIDCDIPLDGVDFKYYPDIKYDRFIIEDKHGFYICYLGKFGNDSYLRVKHDIVVNSSRPLISYLRPNEIEKENINKGKDKELNKKL